MIKLLFALIFFFHGSAQAQMFKPIKDWKYVPADEEFWKEINDLIEKEEYQVGFRLIAKQLKKAKTDFEKLESHLAIATICRKLNYPGCVYTNATYVINASPSSMPSMAALILLSDETVYQPKDDEEIKRIINRGAFKEIPPSLVSMVNFHVALDNLSKGKVSWAKSAAKNVDKASYWGVRLQFYNALDLLKQNRVDESLSAMQQALASSSPYPRLNNIIRHQVARLLFEKGNYDEAENLYKTFHHASRNYGQIVLERAWTQYYKKDYSTSLGLLETLKTPYFENSIHPEQYILSMLIYKELCRYDYGTTTAKIYFDKFSPIINHLKRRRPIDRQRIILSMGLNSPQVYDLANLVNELHSENKKIFEDFNLDKLLKARMQALSVSKEKQIRRTVQRNLREKLEKIANLILDSTEQIKVLDYIVRIDKFRLQQLIDERNYQSEEVENFAIDKLYWPITEETWWEELSNYRVLISDRCQELR